MRKSVLATLFLSLAIAAVSPVTAQTPTLEERADPGDGSAALELATSLLTADAPAEDIAAGVAYLRQAVEADVPDAMVRLGDYTRDGSFGLTRDAVAAAALYERGRVLGNSGAAVRLATFYRSGAPGIDRNPERAEALLREAIAAGNSGAMQMLAQMLVDGTLPVDQAMARTLYQQAIDIGDTGAIVALAREMAKGNFDDAGAVDAIAKVEPLIEQGNGAAKRLVADLMRSGAEGLAKDPVAALASYRDLAASGDTWGARLAADMMIKGEAGAADFEGGIALLKPIGDKGDASVLLQIGDYYANPSLGGQSSADAIAYYERARDLGNPAAVMRLAELYRKGAPDLEVDMDRAAGMLREAAESGNTAAMRGLAALLLDGSLPKDQAAARALFQDAIELGDTEATIVLSREIVKGSFDGAAPADALDLLEPLVGAGNASAKRIVADLLRSGAEGLAKDPAAALAGYRDLAAAGDAWGARLAADMMIKGEAGAADFDGGIALLKPIGDKGDAGVLLQIGDYYANPALGGHSSAEAIAHYERAMALGNRAAMLKLGDLYRKGADDLPADPARAATYLDDAAAASHNGARRMLAAMLLDGTLPVDADRAVGLYEAAIQDGDTSAAPALANAYLNGTGLEPDAPRAVEVLSAAAETGNVPALLALADVLRRGADGVPKDPAQAFGLVERAVALNDPGALRRKADMLARGEGMARDVEAAVAVLEPLARAGDASLLIQLGDYFSRPEFESVDVERAMAYFTSAAELGNVAATLRLGDLYRTGLGPLAADRDAALGFYEAAATTGDIGAIRRLADLLLEGSPEDRQRGFELYRGLGDRGDVWGSIVLADLYAKGRGVVADGAKAIAVLEPLAADGQPNARIALADIYRNGAPGVARDEPKAREIYQQVADLEDATGIKRLADMMARGQGGMTDADGAVSLLESLAMKGDTGAMLQLGDLLSRAEFGIVDAAAAVAAYQQAADTGNASALVRIADLYRNGAPGFARDNVRAATFLEDAVALGDNGARQRLGRMLLDGSLPSDPQRGVALLEAAADTGDRGAILTLAGILARGEGVPADGEKALMLLTPLIESGQTNAMVNLADLYRYGSPGIAQDVDSAVRLYEQAIALGDLGSAKRLGEMLVRGEAGEADFDRGASLVSVAAEAGDVGALLQLGDFYSRPDYGRADPERATEYYRRAAESGNASGFTRLGDLYRRGIGALPADADAATAFYEQAVDKGDNAARRNLASLLLEAGGNAGRERALGLYEDATAAGDSGSALALASYFADGKHVPADYERAKGYYEAAVQLGNRSAPAQWGSLLANGPLAGRHKAEGVAVLESAVAAGAPNALPTLSRLQMSGQIPGADAGTALAALTDAADKGDASAAQMLVQTLRDGFSNSVKRSPGRARDMLEQYSTLFAEEQRRTQFVLMDAVEASSATQYGKMLDGFEQLAASSQAGVLGTLRWRQQNAYVYVMQSILTDYGYYSGNLTGLLTGSTISAFNRACRTVLDKSSCDRGPLSGETAPVLGLLMTQPKPGTDPVQVPA